MNIDQKIQKLCSEIFFKTYFQLNNKDYTVDSIPYDHQVFVTFYYYPEFNEEKEKFLVSNISCSQEVILNKTIKRILKKDIKNMGIETTNGLFLSNIKENSKSLNPDIYWRNFYALITKQGIIYKEFPCDNNSKFILETMPDIWEDSKFLNLNPVIQFENENIDLKNLCQKNHLKENFVFIKNEQTKRPCWTQNEENFQRIIKRINENQSICIYVQNTFLDSINGHKLIDFGIKHKTISKEINSFAKIFQKEESEFYENLKKAFEFEEARLKERGNFEFFFLRKFKNITLVYKKTFNIDKNNFLISEPIGYFKS